MGKETEREGEAEREGKRREGEEQMLSSNFFIAVCINLTGGK